MKNVSKTGKIIFKYLPTILTFLCFAIVLTIAVILNQSYDTHMESTLDYYQEGWVVVVDGVESKVSFPFSLDYDIKECEMKNTLDVVTDTDCLIFEYQYQDVSMYVDGELVFDFDAPKAGQLHTVLGTNILSIPLKSEYSGKTITLKMHTLKATKSITINHIFVAPPGDYLYSIYHRNITQLVIAVVLLVLGFFYLLIYVALKIRKIKVEAIPVEFFLSFFMFSFFISLWVLCDLHLLFITTGNIVISDILAYFSFMSIPVGFVFVVYHLIRRFRKIFTVFELAYTTNVVIQTLLFATGIVDLAYMLTISQGMMFIGLLITITLVILAAIKHPARNTIILSVSFGVFGVLAAYCLIGYIFIPGFNYNFYFLIGMIVLTIGFVYLSIVEFLVLINKNHYMKQEIKYAYIDALTGIGNRRAYEDFINNEKHSASNETFGIINFDVNFLKQSNDSLGHQAGDELLVAAAKLLQEVFHENVYRVGGDEFAALVHLEKEDIRIKLVTLKYKVQSWRGNYNSYLSIAVGYALKKDYPNLSLEELNIKADEEMYKMKKLMHDNHEERLLFNE